MRKGITNGLGGSVIAAVDVVHENQDILGPFSSNMHELHRPLILVVIVITLVVLAPLVVVVAVVSLASMAVVVVLEVAAQVRIPAYPLKHLLYY
ncbi:hypothetical protein EV2_039098 [Malus domestica]